MGASLVSKAAGHFGRVASEQALGNPAAIIAVYNTVHGRTFSQDVSPSLRSGAPSVILG